jgi:hypothetical protein
LSVKAIHTASFGRTSGPSQITLSGRPVSAEPIQTLGRIKHTFAIALSFGLPSVPKESMGSLVAKIFVRLGHAVLPAGTDE